MTSEVPDLPGLTDLSLLGRGGLADVYLARQQHLERWVAAKVFRVTLADDQAAERFRAECRAIGRLDQYPHVLTVYDAGVLGDGRPYLVSERCDGSLHDLVGMRGPLPADRVAALGSTIGRALRFAHSAGVLHGDVTPQNLLLRTSGAPVLADFGLAVLRDHAPTAAGFTLLHAAPEALRSGTVIDERVDVYGLGSTLYTVLTGTP
ncbi:MAG: serine/threonine protein kinase, partial [Actinomycetota bacterium]|nr:serine/threonine protein kinase [Actinomycetota bacterium]